VWNQHTLSSKILTSGGVYIFTNDFILIIAQNEKKLTKLQQQNATLTDNAQRRLTGQQLQGQVKKIYSEKKIF
jgi:hypothetical protein